MISNLNALATHYNSGATKTYEERRSALINFKSILLKYETDIYQALYNDLKKGKEEAYVTELGMILHEINFMLSHLKRLMKPKKVGTNIFNFPSTSKIHNQPLGVVFIIAPWNYPFQLALLPLVGAIAAGNCVALKPSELAPFSATLIEKIIAETFAENHVYTLQGDGAVVVNQALDNFKFNHIFYTGSTFVGKLIYKKAAENLIPVTLELGGKSPCLVTQSADIATAAKRITLAKFSNCGQMCVTPDYVLVHQSKKEALIIELKKSINSFFTTNAQQSEAYGKIINEKRFDEISTYLTQGNIEHGGHTNREQLYIEPTIITEVDFNSPIMQQEIFGPVLPVIGYNTQKEALEIIAKNSNPLAFYIYTTNKQEESFFIDAVSFGGGCVNNSAFHLTNPKLPFGGIGNSGLGSYHGKTSYETFSHSKSVLHTPNWIDPFIKYPPFNGRMGIFKKLLG
jgi:aldehyde dehydrogenase (NAD+)